MTPNPTIGDNRAVYSPGDRVLSRDGSLKEGVVQLANDTYRRALVHWADAPDGSQDRWFPYDNLQKVVDVNKDDSTVTGSPNSVVGVSGGGPGPAGAAFSEPFRTESLDEARARRNGLDVVASSTIPIYGGHPTWSGQPGGSPMAGPNDTMGHRPQQPPNLHSAAPNGDTQFLTDQMCSSCRWWDPENLSQFPNALGDPVADRGGCMRYRVATGAQQVCDSWTGRAGYDLAIVIDESEPRVLELSDDIQGTKFEKVALKTGLLAGATPTGSGTLGRPLVVVDGRTEYGPDGSVQKIGLDDVLDSINDPAFERITVPKSHADRVDENTGYVVKGYKREDPERPGEKQLVLEQVITEPDIADKIKRKSIYGSSVGLVFDYVRKSDLKRFPVALKHNALTNVPWVRGLGEHSVTASEGFEESIDGTGFRSVESYSYMSDDEHPLVKEGKALSDGNGGYRWPIRNARDLAKAKEAFGRAKPSERGKIKAWINKRARELNKPLMGQQSVTASEPPSGGANATHEGGDRVAQGDAQAAQLELRLAETQDLINAQQAELNRVHADLHRRNVEDRISGWSSKGLDKLPGLLKTVRRIMLEDDGGPAMVLHLSEEEGSGTKEITASSIVEMIVDSLPLSEDGTKFQLSGQLFAPDTTVSDATRPPMHMADSDDFDMAPAAVKSRADEAAAELGLPTAKKAGEN